MNFTGLSIQCICKCAYVIIDISLYFLFLFKEHSEPMVLEPGEAPGLGGRGRGEQPTPPGSPAWREGRIRTHARDPARSRRRSHDGAGYCSQSAGAVQPGRGRRTQPAGAGPRGGGPGTKQLFTGGRTPLWHHSIRWVGANFTTIKYFIMLLPPMGNRSSMFLGLFVCLSVCLSVHPSVHSTLVNTI